MGLCSGKPQAQNAQQPNNAKTLQNMQTFQQPNKPDENAEQLEQFPTNNPIKKLSTHKETQQVHEQSANKDTTDMQQIPLNSSQRQQMSQLESESQIYEYLVGDKVYNKVINGEDINATVQTIKFLDNKQIMSVAKSISLGLNQMEPIIYQLDRMYPSDILQNYQNIVQPSMLDLMEHDLTHLKNKELTYQCLVVTCKSYHILQDMKGKGKAQKCYTEEKKDPEAVIAEELALTYGNLQRAIKLEIIQTFAKSTKQQVTHTTTNSNPLQLMKFNTKHAITLAKQQTIKNNDQNSNGSNQQEAFDSLFDLLETKKVGQEVFKYNISNMKPSHRL